MENECAEKRLTFNTLKDQVIKPEIVAILVVQLFAMLGELKNEVVREIDVDDLIVVTDDHIIGVIPEEAERHRDDILHLEAHILLKSQIFPPNAVGKI